MKISQHVSVKTAKMNVGYVCYIIHSAFFTYGHVLLTLCVKAIALCHQSLSWCASELQISWKSVGGLQVSKG